jgi:S-ribosylhomocysteine lyase LuxS involved in autoinducer biosynthesis
LVVSGLARGHPGATAIDLSAAWNATDAELAAGFHPLYRAAIGRLPEGEQVFRGLPFRLGSRASGARWIAVDRPTTIDLRGTPAASHVVVAHLCDARHDADGRRPAGVPLGWVEPVGEPLARYTAIDDDDDRHEVIVRRRFEVDEGILGWGAGPFLAVGHRLDEPIDWRGPHPRQSRGRYAEAGHAGPLTVLPAGWGPDQTGVADVIPSPDDDAVLWLHAIALARRRRLTRLVLEPYGAGGPGSAVAVAAITLFDGTADPLVLGPRRQLLVRGRGAAPPAPVIDLGQVIRSIEVDEPGGDGPDIVGWGSAPPGAPPVDPGRVVVDVALAADAALRIGDWMVPRAVLDDGGRAASPDGSLTIEALPTPDVRVTVTVHGPEGDDPTACRVRFVAPDGRYLPPLGHREEVNPGLYEDTGAGLVLGRETYAYVPGRFEIDLPPGPVRVEVVKGFDHRPIRTELVVEPRTRRHELRLERPIDLRPAGWMTSDSHVHFLAPSTALLQAAAEDVSIVHLLATQWGDHFTGVTDLPWGSMGDPTGSHRVVVGTENRQAMLGHLGLLGARRPVLPMASAGPPEGRIGGALAELLADWADRCHDADGLVVAVHFPLPYAEIAADIVAGRIDAVEMQCFAPGLDNPSILEWYRFLDLGYRLPVLGGTDKMSAEVPLGAVRTYARVDPDGPRSPEAWAAAIRAGRTFATSGPTLELSVDGHEPGDVIALPASGGRLQVRARAAAAQPMITTVELVVNGRVVAAETAAAPTDDLGLDATVEIRSGSWIAARSRSDRQIGSAFATSMAAHTSPVYVEVVDHPLLVPDEAGVVLEVIEGTRRWVESIAAVGRPANRRRMVDFLADSAATLRTRLDRARREVD